MRALLPSLSAALLGFLLIGCATTNSPSTQTSGSHAQDYQSSQADVVVLNFFDMYCPHCQTAAKYVNEIYAMTQARSVSTKIDFYGVGWGNTPMEVDLYQKRFAVKYPLIPDRDLRISSRFKKFRPPLLLALRKQGGQWTEFYRTTEIRGNSAEIFSHLHP